MARKAKRKEKASACSCPNGGSGYTSNPMLCRSCGGARSPADCRCAGPKYHPDKPCPVHPKNGPHAKEVP